MLTGIYPALPTPFFTDGTQIAYEKIKSVCDSLFADGVHGLFICGTTGEGPYLTASEKIAVTAATIEAVDGRGKVLVQIAGSDLPGTLEAARQAYSFGADGVSLLHPWYFKCDQEGLYQYIARVADFLEDMPLYLYNLPLFTGNNIEPATVERLLNRFDNICGMKESGSLEDIKRWKSFLSDDFQVVCGNDTGLTQLFRMGGKAVVSSTANVQPKAFCACFEAAQKGDWDEAEKQQEQIKLFLTAMQTPNGIAVIKSSLRLKGIDAGAVRMPNRELSDDEVQNLKQFMEENGIL